ncbi:protein-L-isoaspartate(D-aspartate) O-methyltransferase [Chrysiogenes arsenatis]|uniref:protein-L-isoaspartate(D-aspartate) O-methyltransferase n=1 Tax=Chrysiogenes arsenatis TaxID=309797 RepID=UPI00041A320F|nr:protein-L-isoaspartate(D-aspartate) O-methyltransferase [Chrysiogenes arsenatis]
MFQTACQNLIRRYIIPAGVHDARVLDALATVPRHHFVDPALDSRAYMNIPLPIGFGQTISQPSMVALMTQELELTGAERVLEIGTGSGYQAAILAKLAAEVYTIERIPELAWRAIANLSALGVENVSVKIADGTKAADEAMRYDRIMVTAGGNQQPFSLLRQLAPHGILLIPIGNENEQTLYKYRKVADGRCERSEVNRCSFVKLIGEEGWTSEAEALLTGR